MKQTIEELLFSQNTTVLTNEDKGNIKQVFLTTLSDQTTQEYFEILLKYMKAKRKLKMSTVDVSIASDVPEVTIARFENLQAVPQTITLMKILASVNLGIQLESLSDS
jgi:hypothetical protein